MISDTLKIHTEHTAGPQLIGFDYQIFYFLYLSLDLNPGEKLGFEILDDIHIEFPNGNLELLQMKHTIQTNASGEKINLTERDNDLWKTISNWVAFVNAAANTEKYILNTSFTIVTNKSITSNNFLKNLAKLQTGEIEIKEINEYILLLFSGTSDNILKERINQLIKLKQKVKKSFLCKINIVSDQENIISQIKGRIHKLIRREDRIDDVFNAFYTNIQVDKFLTIAGRGKFSITFEDFSNKYKTCFDFAYTSNNLPIRNLPLIFPDKLKEQLFIKQLIEIGETDQDEEILNYTTAMLKFFNQIKDWVTEGDLLETDKASLDKDAIFRWQRIFKEKYREIKKKITAGISSDDLEEEIKESAIACVNEMRREKLSIKNNELTEEFSNGQFYLLSNEPLIGWHLDWENKYKQ
jgi:hypothetical protein